MNGWMICDLGQCPQLLLLVTESGVENSPQVPAV